MAKEERVECKTVTTICPRCGKQAATYKMDEAGILRFVSCACCDYYTKDKGTK